MKRQSGPPAGSKTSASGHTHGPSALGPSKLRPAALTTPSCSRLATPLPSNHRQPPPRGRRPRMPEADQLAEGVVEEQVELPDAPSQTLLEGASKLRSRQSSSTKHLQAPLWTLSSDTSGLPYPRSAVSLVSPNDTGFSIPCVSRTPQGRRRRATPVSGGRGALRVASASGAVG